jgi:hypothetical protein
MEALFFLKHIKRTMARFTTVSGLLLIGWLLVAPSAPAAEEKDRPLTNTDVLKMLQAKIPESVILAKIRASKVKFDSSTDAIIELHKRGVGEKVLSAMVDPKGVSPEDAKSADKNPSGAGKPLESLPASSDISAGAKPDPLTAGLVKSRVKKGVTTQLDLFELFGAPQQTTIDRDGTEVWMYDKTASTVSSTSKQMTAENRKSEAEVMAGFLGIPLVGGVGAAKAKGKEDTKVETEGTGIVTRSVKTITFIIKFNADKTVKDYSVRQASY